MTSHHPGGQAFTDKDLKQMKEDSENHTRKCSSDCAWREYKLKTLLARLEAAEAYVKFDHQNWIEGGPKQEALYQAWRKAAGK